MRGYIGRMLRRLAPRTMDNLVYLSKTKENHGGVTQRLHDYERELRELRMEIEELRLESLRVYELYEEIFDEARSASEGSA